MQAVNNNTKVVFLSLSAAQVFFAIWAFIALCYHCSQAISTNGGKGVGGRLGFGYVCFVLFILAFWSLITAVSFQNKYDAAKLAYVQAGVFFVGIVFNWIMIFVVAGAYWQLSMVFLESSSSYNASFEASARAVIGALSLSFIVSIVHAILLFISRNTLLGQAPVQSSEEPQQPSNIPYSPQNDQNTYYAAPANGQGGEYYQPQQPQQPGYSNYDAPQSNGGVYA